MHTSPLPSYDTFKTSQSLLSSTFKSVDEIRKASKVFYDYLPSSAVLEISYSCLSKPIIERICKEASFGNHLFFVGKTLYEGGWKFSLSPRALCDGFIFSEKSLRAVYTINKKLFKNEFIQKHIVNKLFFFSLLWNGHDCF